MKLQSAPHSPFKSLRVILPLAFAALAITLPKCGTSPSTSTPAAGTFTNVYAIFTAAQCSRCHTPPATSANENGSSLNLSTQALAYSTLVGTTATPTTVTATDNSACSTVKLVNTATPANSYLLAIFTPADQVTGFGSASCRPDASHLQSDNLSADQLTTITNWITAGALNN